MALNNLISPLEAVSLLKEGHVVVLPTETVYGLGGNAYNKNTLDNIYAIKKRPRNNPLILHYDSPERALQDVVLDHHNKDMVEKLIHEFWPGPLTILLRKNPLAPLNHFPEAIALRVPAHPIMQEVLRNLSFPLGAPSANPSGYLSPTRAQHVLKNLPGVPVLDGGPCSWGLESTIVDCRQGNAVKILRLGAISPENIARALWGSSENTSSLLMGSHSYDHEKSSLDSSKNEIPESLRGSFLKGRQKKIESLVCPGLLLRHYEPKKPMRLLEGPSEPLPGEILLSFGQPYENFFKIFPLSPGKSLEEMAHNLFQGLHRADEDPQCRSIAVMPFPKEGLGLALWERLYRGSQGFLKENSR